MAKKNYSLDSEHHNTAKIYSNLAKEYESQCRYKEAKEFYLMALNLNYSRTDLEMRMLSTADTYNNIARLYESQFNFDKAEKYYFKAIDRLKNKIC